MGSKLPVTREHGRAKNGNWQIIHTILPPPTHIDRHKFILQLKFIREPVTKIKKGRVAVVWLCLGHEKTCSAKLHFSGFII